MPKQTTTTNRLPAYAALLAVAMIWGISGPVIKYTLNYIPPFLFLFLRMAIATACLVPLIIHYEKTANISWRQLRKLALLGFLGTTVTLSLFFVGFNHTSAVEGSLLSILAPILIVLGGAIFLKENVTKREWAGLTITIFGSLIVTAGPLISGNNLNSGREHLIGNAIILLANISWAAYTLWSKKLLTQRIPPTIQIGAAFATGTLTSIPLALWEWWRRPTDILILIESHIPWMGILYMALLSSIAAYFLYVWGFEKIEASEATLFAYIQPLFALPTAYLMLGEIPHRMFWLGAVVITAGVVLTEWREGGGKKAAPTAPWQ